MAHIREYDGGRGVDIDVTPDFVFIEAGGHCYAFDKAMFLHQVKRAFGIAFIVEEVAAVPN